MQWSTEKAWAWYQQHPWQCGFNYLPRTAVNYTDFWLTFDEPIIEQELGWARAVGFNSVRVVLSYVVWQHDPAAMRQKFGRFVQIAHAHDISVIPTPLDDCGFSGLPSILEAMLPPVPNVHNSRAMASPGREVVMQRDNWPQVIGYVQELVQAFADDKRVLLWDLYNEPGNRMIFSADGTTQLFDEALEAHSHELMVALFDAVRQIDPIQPLTIGGWRVPPPWEDETDQLYIHPTDVAAFELSDVISFHAYCTPDRLGRILDNLRGYDRPIFCTEWMARHIGSDIVTQLPIFHQHEVGCYQWGLVRGKTQTHLPWPDVRRYVNGVSTQMWFHDLLHPNGTPYDEAEIGMLKQLV